MAVRWADGEKAIDFLLERGRLERVAVDVEAACAALLERAAKRLDTARAAMSGEDWEGAFSNAYDVYRMAAEVLLLRQGLRATGGDGSHVAVEDAVSGQFAGAIVGFSKVRFERMRQGRHASQYFDPARPEKPMTTPAGLWSWPTASWRRRSGCCVQGSSISIEGWGPRGGR